MGQFFYYSNMIFFPIMAKLYFKYSGMNAGKSTALLQAAHNYSERGMDVIMYTAEIDKRMGEATVGSRIGISAPSRVFNEDTDMYAEVKNEHLTSPIAAVLIDESQWLTKKQVWDLAKLADEHNIPIMCYGLRTDFRGELFDGSAALLAIADTINEIKTICDCGRKATMTVRVDVYGNAVHEGPQTEVGGDDRYVSFCRKHWVEKMNS